MTDALEPIHKKFAKQAGTQWIRTDIWALLAGSYALLLSSSPTLISSPRHSSTSPGRPHGSAEVRRSFRYCLRCLTELKAITFAKNSLLPVLRRPYQYPGTKCDASEFYLLGLSEFVSKLLDIFSSSSLPPSRKNWQTEQEEGLQLERENQKQRAEFRLWAGQYDQGPKEEAVPSSVNLMKRPDCIDDLIVLALSVADLGPEYALKFWDVSGPDDDQGASKVSLSPSRALNAIQKASSDDDSLIPFYLAFLGALAKAESPELEQSGAGVVNKLLFTAGASNKYDWRQLLEAIRWYVRRFNDTGSSSTSATTSSGPSSTSYYYRTVNLMNNPRQAAQTANTSESTELGDEGKFFLLSLLNLISNVASKSPESRVQLLSLQLAIKSESSSTFFGNDATLNILFSFGTAPLPPEIRGMTFTAIANLLNNDSLGTEDRTKMLDFSLKAWELVESCQVLPILLLDQYPQVVGEEMLRSKNGIKFPASSTSLVSIRVFIRLPSGLPSVDKHKHSQHHFLRAFRLEAVLRVIPGFLLTNNMRFSMKWNTLNRERGITPQPKVFCVC